MAAVARLLLEQGPVGLLRRLLDPLEDPSEATNPDSPLQELPFRPDGGLSPEAVLGGHR